MHEQLHARLEALRKECDAGEAELDQVEQRRTYLRETLLRIGGAMQVLEELLAEAPPIAPNGADQREQPSPMTAVK